MNQLFTEHLAGRDHSFALWAIWMLGAVGAYGKGGRLSRCSEAYLSSSVLTIGWFFAFQSPLYAASLYLWLAFPAGELGVERASLPLNLSYIAACHGAGSLPR